MTVTVHSTREEHPNLPWFRALCEAADSMEANQASEQEPSIDNIRDSIADDVVVHTFGASRFAGDSVGWEQFKAHVDQLRTAGDSLQQEPVGYYADDNWTMVSWIITVARGDRKLSMPAVGVWRLGDDGKLVEHWEILKDQQAWDAFVATQAERSDP